MNLKPFCSKCGELSEPFSDDEYSYATDGAILIRVPRQDDIKKDTPVFISRRTSSRAIVLVIRDDVGLYFNHDTLTNWIDMPMLPNMAVCEKCNGTGKFRAACFECYGDGMLTFDSEYNTYKVECMSCSGGKSDGILCDKCEGEGKAPEVRLVDVGGARAIAKDLYRLKDLPDLKFSIVGKDWREPVRFKFAGGVGLLQNWLE